MVGKRKGGRIKVKKGKYSIRWIECHSKDGKIQEKTRQVRRDYRNKEVLQEKRRRGCGRVTE